MAGPLKSRKLELCSNGYLPITQQYTPAAHRLRKLGLNVEVAVNGWANLTTRRASKKSVDEGGWSLLGTSWFGADMLHPGLNQSLRTNGATAWFARPKDDKLEPVRSQWMRATDSEARKEFAAAIQECAFEVVPYIPTGQWKTMTAYRKNLKDLVLGPVIFSGVSRSINPVAPRPCSVQAPHAGDWHRHCCRARVSL